MKLIKRKKLVGTKKGYRKYGNIKTVVDGIKFDSKKEARRYSTLKLMQESGIISELICQPKFKLIVPGLGPVKIKGKVRQTTSTYTPDFQYKKDGELIIEDVKSPATANDKYFKLKRAIFELIYKVDLTLV